MIRPYRPADRAAVYDVCVRTGYEGGDARGVYSDPELLPAVFAGPYLELEPELAFVLDDGERAVGYVLGTADTVGFAAAFRARWLPTVAARYPAPAGPPASLEQEMRALLHHPEEMIRPELAAYPAHLHIDLLPGYQRAGHGRALISAFLGALRTAGVPGVHLAVGTANASALAFYDRTGFAVIDVPDPGPLTYLGRAA